MPQLIVPPVPYAKDANEIAAEFERREEQHTSTHGLASKRGTFSYWSSALSMVRGQDPLTQSSDVLVEIHDGVIILTSVDKSLEFITPAPGSYACLIRNSDAGE